MKHSGFLKSLAASPEWPGNAEVRGAHTLPCPLPAPDFPQGLPVSYASGKPEWGGSCQCHLLQSRGTLKQEGTGKQSQTSTFLSPLFATRDRHPFPLNFLFLLQEISYMEFFFNMNHFLKVFIEFVTILLLFCLLVFCLRGMWYLSAPTRDRTSTPCIGRQCLNHWTPEKSFMELF